MQTNADFKKLLQDTGYTVKDISTMLNTSYNTVKNWTRSPDAKGYRHMPKHALIAARLSIESKVHEEQETPT